MPVRGDFNKLTRVIHNLEEVASPKRKVELNRKLAEQALAFIDEGFDRERDPYGRRWKRIKHRRGRILQDTGRMRSSFKVSAVTTNYFRVSASVFYANFHQTGTSRMPARKMVPDDLLPAKWEQAFDRIIREHIGPLVA